MILTPSKAFLIDYKINNPSDTATHYVRAVVKNAISGITLASLNLTDNGSSYFSREWITPGDPSGTGLQISILTTVYDDAGYTTESLVYGTTLTSYIVRDLAGIRSMLGGGVQGQQFDYKEIEKIIRAVVLENKPVEIEKYNDEHVVQAIQDVQKDVREVKDEVILSGSQNIDAVEAVGENLKTHITKTEKSADIKKHVSEQVGDKVTVEQFKDLVGQILSFMRELTDEEKQDREHLKQRFSEFVKQVETALDKPVQIELQPNNGVKRGKEPEPEVVEEDPREKMLKKFITE